MQDLVRAPDRIRVMIVEDNAEVVQAIVDCFAKKPDIEIIAIETDGFSAKNAAILTQPDVMVLDLVLPRLDGFAVMQELRELGLTNIRIIVLSGMHSDFMIRRALQLGAFYYMVKPFSPEILYGHIAQRTPDMSERDPDPLPLVDEDMEMTLLLADVLGMSSRLKGTEYLKSAALIARGLSEMGGRITKEIYPAVAELHRASAAQVERAIRHTIDIAWTRGPMKASGLFRGVRRPSNGEVIRALAKKDLSRRSRTKEE